MSSNDKERPTDTADDAEFPAQDRIATDLPAETGSGRSNTIAWLAVLLSLIALCTVAYTVFEDWRNSDESETADTLASISTLERRIDESGNTLAALSSQVEQLPRQDSSGEINSLRRDIDQQLGLLSALPSRMSSLESSVAALAGVSESARDTFLLAEAEYYLQIANAQLQLANNPPLATLALGMADERVTQLSNPALTAVRRAIAEELAALEVMEKADIEGATLTLASLARVVESLPLAAHADTGEEAEAEQEGAWQSVKSAMSGLVKVTPPDQAKLALISPDAEYFLRNNIAMQLQAARLALLRGEQAIFETILDDTSTLLNNYFDNDSSQVASTQQTIAEIRDTVFTTATPDISESLRLLRQFRTLSETKQ